MTEVGPAPRTSGRATPGAPAASERGPDGAPGRVHFPPFDGLRALAAIGVAVTHAAFISGFNARSDFWGPFAARLDVGVAVFFVISGFLLYRPFVAGRFLPSKPPAVRDYLRRRALRIYPAFWVAFTLVVFVLPRPVDDVPDLGALVAHYTLTHIYFEDLVLGPLQQSWTLATEVSFYLLLPVYAWSLRRGHGPPRRRLRQELFGLGGLYALSIAFRWWVRVVDAERAGMYETWLPARTDMFALGMLLAVLSVWWARPDRRAPDWTTGRALPWTSWTIALGCLYVASKELGLEAPGRRGPVDLAAGEGFALHFLYGAVAFFLVVPAVLGPLDRGLIRGFLNRRSLQWLGLVSYGIYLWHEAVLDAWLVWFDRAPFAPSSVLDARYPWGLDAPFVEMSVFMLASTIAIAAASWYVIERPALTLGHRSRARRDR